MRGQGDRAGCGPSFFSSRHLHGELPSALEPQFPTQTGQMLLQGARGFGCTGKTGRDYRQAEWICLNPSRSHWELITATVIVWEPHSLYSPLRLVQGPPSFSS